jgi:hypothetical protein
MQNHCASGSECSVQYFEQMYSQLAAATVPTHLVCFFTVCYSTSYVLQIYCSAFLLHLHFREHFHISTPPHSCLYNARRLHTSLFGLISTISEKIYMSHLFLRLRLPLWPSLYVFSCPSLALISRWQRVHGYTSLVRPTAPPPPLSFYSIEPSTVTFNFFNLTLRMFNQLIILYTVDFNCNLKGYHIQISSSSYICTAIMCGPLVHDDIYNSCHNGLYIYHFCNCESPNFGRINLDNTPLYSSHLRSCLRPSVSCTKL